MGSGSVLHSFSECKCISKEMERADVSSQWVHCLLYRSDMSWSSPCRLLLAPSLLIYWNSLQKGPLVEALRARKPLHYLPLLSACASLLWWRATSLLKALNLLLYAGDIWNTVVEDNSVRFTESKWEDFLWSRLFYNVSRTYSSSATL